MKLRNLTTHAIQIMFQVPVKDGAKPEVDILHIPPAMGKGYIVVDKEIWDKVKDITITVPQMVSEEVLVEGVTVDNKPVMQTIQVPTGEKKTVNLIQKYFRDRELEEVLDETSTRIPEETKMIEELNDLGFMIDPSIDSTKLLNLHNKFSGKKEVLTPTAAVAVTKP